MYPALLAALSLLLSHPHPQDLNALHFRVDPIPRRDRTDLAVSVRFRSVGADSLVVGLPADVYGTPSIHRFVTSFEGDSGTTVGGSTGSDQRVVWPGSGGVVRLRYVLSFDPREMDETSFGPSTGPTHFHVAGAQWLLRIGPDTVRRRYIIDLVGLPMGWHAYSSISANPRIADTTISYEDLITSAIGAGAGETSRFTVHGKPVSVVVEGRFAIPADEILTAVRRIVTLQRDWFRDYHQPFYHVVIMQRSGIIAGTAVDNLFKCFVKPEVSRDQLFVLLSHEMFHNWLPNSMTITPPAGESELRYEWFGEGFDDYFARQVLAEAGLLSPNAFAELVNQDIINIADNPHRAATYADVRAANRTGRYGTVWKKLSYYRGALIALNWDAQLRRAESKRRLADLIRELYAVASTHEGRLSEDGFFGLAHDYGLDASADFERFILRGEPITPDSTALGNGYVLTETAVPSFDPGLSLEETFRTRAIAGIVEGGAAYRAGLRNGMELVSVQNSNRFGNGWDFDRPMVVTVRADGAERVVDVSPRGAALLVRLFRPR